MKKQKNSLPKIIDINTFDFTSYGRELTREEAYFVNGGQVMSQVDQYAMAKAHERSDQAAMDAIVAKKSFSGYELITNSCGIAARNSLTVEGSGINCYFDSPVPNFIDDDLSASNNNCWREKI